MINNPGFTTTSISKEINKRENISNQDKGIAKPENDILLIEHRGSTSSSEPSIISMQDMDLSTGSNIIQGKDHSVFSRMFRKSFRKFFRDRRQVTSEEQGVFYVSEKDDE